MILGVVVNLLLVLFQAGSSLRFFKLTRHMKEVGCMPHVVNILTIISGTSLSLTFWLIYRDDTKTAFMTVSIIGLWMSNMLRYRFMIRLIRVQVQLMSEKELTKIIIEKMRRSKVIEWILLVLMVVVIICFVSYYLL